MSPDIRSSYGLNLMQILNDLPFNLLTHAATRKRLNGKSFEISRTFGAKFPWAKLVLRQDGKLHHVRCKIYTKVE